MAAEVDLGLQKSLTTQTLGSGEGHGWTTRRMACFLPRTREWERTRREGSESGPHGEAAVMAGGGRPPEGRQGRGPGPAAEQQSPPNTAVSSQGTEAAPGHTGLHKTSTVLARGSFPV